MAVIVLNCNNGAEGKREELDCESRKWRGFVRGKPALVAARTAAQPAESVAFVRPRTTQGSQLAHNHSSAKLYSQCAKLNISTSILLKLVRIVSSSRNSSS